MAATKNRTRETTPSKADSRNPYDRMRLHPEFPVRLDNERLHRVMEELRPLIDGGMEAAPGTVDKVTIPRALYGPGLILISRWIHAFFDCVEDEKERAATAESFMLVAGLLTLVESDAGTIVKNLIRTMDLIAEEFGDSEPDRQAAARRRLDVLGRPNWLHTFWTIEHADAERIADRLTAGIAGKGE